MPVDYRQRIYAKYASNFQDAGQTFNEQASQQWGKAYRYYLRGWLPSSKDGNIAEVACGGGRLLHFLKLEGYHRLCAVDFSSEQVSLARQVVPDVTEGDATQFLEGHSNQFDLIIGLDIIEHFHKPEVLRFLDACNGALRAGGRLILQTPNMDSPWGVAHRYNDFTHEVGFNINALSRLLHLAEFEAIEPREAGPVPFGYSTFSTLRYVVWQIIRVGLYLWNRAETGTAGNGVFTRVFIISGVRK